MRQILLCKRAWKETHAPQRKNEQASKIASIWEVSKGLGMTWEVAQCVEQRGEFCQKLKQQRKFRVIFDPANNLYKSSWRKMPKRLLKMQDLRVVQGAK